MQNINIDTAQRRKGRRDFLILMAVFFTPIIAALVLYNNLDKLHIAGTKSHGNLIQPPRKLQDVPLTNRNGEAFRFSEIRDKWILVIVGAATCDKQCEQDLYLMRQIRLAQGGDMHRVERLYISTDGQPQPSLLQVVDKYSGTHVVYGDKTATQNIIRQFSHDVGQGEDIQSMYIVDPRGFLMMSYPEGFKPRGAIKDLTRLLKYARAG